MIVEMINNITNALYSDPVYLLIGIILSALILYSLIKKLLKLVVYLSAVLFVYLGYLYMTGQDIPNNVDDMIRQGTEIIQQGGELLEQKFENSTKKEMK